MTQISWEQLRRLTSKALHSGEFMLVGVKTASDLIYIRLVLLSDTNPVYVSVLNAAVERNSDDQIQFKRS